MRGVKFGIRKPISRKRVVFANVPAYRANNRAKRDIDRHRCRSVYAKSSMRNEPAINRARVILNVTVDDRGRAWQFYASVPNRNATRAENSQVSSSMMKHECVEKKRTERGEELGVRRRRDVAAGSVTIKISMWHIINAGYPAFYFYCAAMYLRYPESIPACYRFPFLLLPSLRPSPLKPHERYVACVCVTRQNSRERASEPFARSKVDSRILAL